MAFRLFPSQLEAFASTNRALCNLWRLTGTLRFELPPELVDDRRWRGIASSRRYTLALDSLLCAVGEERKDADRTRLSDLLGKMRVTRRRLAHPKLPPDLAPEAQESEVLRRAMLAVLAEQSHVLQAVVPAKERRSAELRIDRGNVPTGRLPPRQRFAEDWDEDFYEEVASSRGKTEQLVFVMLVENLGRDSLWALQHAGAEVREHEWPGGTPQRHGVLARVLGATFFGEVEGACAVLGRATLYAWQRGETALDAEDAEWLECVAGLRPRKQASDSVKTRLDLASQVEGALTLYGRAYDRDVTKEFVGDDWDAFLKAIALRDRMYHPTGTSDLVPSADDYGNLLKAMGWFRRIRDEVSSATT